MLHRSTYTETGTVPDKDNAIQSSTNKMSFISYVAQSDPLEIKNLCPSEMEMRSGVPNPSQEDIQLLE